MSLIETDHDVLVAAEGSTLWRVPVGRPSREATFAGSIVGVGLEGDRLVLVTDDGMLRWPVRLLVELGMPARALASSGRSVAVAHPTSVTVTSHDTLATRHIEVEDPTALAWSKDETLLVIGARSGRVDVVDATSLETRASWHEDAPVVAITPYGAGFVVVAGARVHLRSSRGEVVRALPVLAQTIRQARTSPTGNLALLGDSVGGSTIETSTGGGHALGVLRWTEPDRIVDFGYDRARLVVLFGGGRLARYDLTKRSAELLRRGRLDEAAPPHAELVFDGAVLPLRVVDVAEEAVAATSESDLVREHDGSPGNAQDDFFVPFDPRIGAPISAHTNCTRHGRKDERDSTPWYAAYRWTASSTVATILAIYGSTLTSVGAPLARTFVALLLVAGLCGIAWSLRDRGTMTVVGPAGLMRVRRRKTEALLFEDTTSILVASSAVSFLGTSPMTRFHESFVRKDGSRFVIEGQSLDAGAPPHDPVHFARSALAAWTRWKTPIANANIEKDGVHTFHAGAQSIGVGPNLLVVESRGRTVRLAREDIAQIFVLQSELVIRPRGAVSTAIERLLERDGFRFATSELSDYPLFVTALREHTGFQL